MSVARGKEDATKDDQSKEVVEWTSTTTTTGKVLVTTGTIPTKKSHKDFVTRGHQTPVLTRHTLLPLSFRRGLPPDAQKIRQLQSQGLSKGSFNQEVVNPKWEIVFLGVKVTLSGTSPPIIRWKWGHSTEERGESEEEEELEERGKVNLFSLV